MLMEMALVQNFSVHPNPTDMYSNRNFSAWAQEVWDVNKTGMLASNRDSHELKSLIDVPRSLFVGRR